MRRRAILREAILKSCASTEERLLGENTHLSDPIRGRESRSRSICSLTRLIGGGGNAALTKGSERKLDPLFPSPSSPWTEASLSTVSIVSTAFALSAGRSAPLLEPAGIALPCPGPGEVVCPLALTPRGARHPGRGVLSPPRLRHRFASGLGEVPEVPEGRAKRRHRQRGTCRPSVLASIRGLVDPRCRYGSLGRRR